MIQTQTIKMFIILTLVLLLVAACGGETQGELPTLMVIPSVTPSFTPTETFTPSPTATFTATLTPTNTLTSTSTPTATPTLSPTPSVTPTYTLTPTFTLTPSATWTNTPAVTATSAAPVILNFSADKAAADAGSQIVLSWNADADSVRIERLNAQLQVVETSVPATVTGSLTVTLPSDSNQAIYRLVATRGILESQLDLPIAITQVCAFAWFFGNDFAPADAGCPTAAPISALGAYQPFQQGFMIHVLLPTSGIDRVYGAQNEGSRYLAYDNQWDGSTITPGTPPAGFFNAQGVFNWVYYNTLASAGTWDQKIGWATANIDNNPRNTQFGEDGSLYVAVGPSAFRFKGGSISGTWTKVK